MLVAVGWWPSEIEFTVDDLATVVKLMNDQRKRLR